VDEIEFDSSSAAQIHPGLYTVRVHRVRDDCQLVREPAESDQDDEQLLVSAPLDVAKNKLVAGFEQFGNKTDKFFSELF
jgi:hypothetical protein